MKEYELSHFKTKVRLNLDEIRANDSGFVGGTDEEDLDSIIEGKLEEAIRYVHQFADPSLVEGEDYVPGKSVVTATNIGNKNKYYSYSTSLPAGCIRILYAYVNGWKKKVSDFVFDSTGDYSALKDVHSTGTPERPKVALVDNATKVELYSVTSVPTGVGTQLDEGQTDTDSDVQLSVVYSNVKKVTTTTVTTGTGESATTTTTTTVKYKVSPKLEEAVYYYLTGLVLQTLRDNHSETMFQQAMIHMGIANKLKEA